MFPKQFPISTKNLFIAKLSPLNLLFLGRGLRGRGFFSHEKKPLPLMYTYNTSFLSAPHPDRACFLKTPPNLLFLDRGLRGRDFFSHEKKLLPLMYTYNNSLLAAPIPIEPIFVPPPTCFSWVGV